MGNYKQFSTIYKSKRNNEFVVTAPSCGKSIGSLSSSISPVQYKQNMTDKKKHDMRHEESCIPCFSDMAASSVKLFTPERQIEFTTMRKPPTPLPVGRKRKLALDHAGSTILEDIMQSVTKLEQSRKIQPKLGQGEPDNLYSSGYGFVKNPSQWVSPGVPRTKYHCINEDCNQFNSFVTDASSGDMLCTKCGASQNRKLFMEEESRLFNDDTTEARNSKIRAESGAKTTATGDVNLMRAQSMLHGKLDDTGSEMLECVMEYAQFMKWGHVDNGHAIFGMYERRALEKDAIEKSYTSISTYVNKIQKAVDEVSMQMNTAESVRRYARELSTKFGAQCFIHDRDCCGGPSCRLNNAKKIPPVLAAAVLLREAHVYETKSIIQFEVYKSTLMTLHVPSNVTEKIGKASTLITDTFKGLPFPCFKNFDPDAALFKTVGDKELTVGFADIHVLSETMGLSYPQSLRTKEILDDWTDTPAIMPQTLMGVAFLRMLKETQDLNFGVSDVSKLVGITPTTLLKWCDDNENLPWPTKTIEHLISQTGVQSDVAHNARQTLFAWLRTTPAAFKYYEWTRSNGHRLTAACALVSGALNVNNRLDVKAFLHKIQQCMPEFSLETVVLALNSHPALRELAVEL
jgi:transcription initiation factor TFIIIB Brf1 subunit/transcription initiation factor TFIIB